MIANIPAIITVAVMLGSVLPRTAHAQTPNIPQSRPIERPMEIPQAESSTEKDSVQFELPPVQTPLPENLSKAQRVRVKDFVFEGNTVISNEEISAIIGKYFTEPYSGAISAGDLQQIRLDVTRLYISRNFINSGVLLPDQEITDGIVRYKVIEGTLAEIDITSSGKLGERYIAKYFAGYSNQVLNTDTIRQKLFMLQLDPRVKRVKADLVPAPQLGSARLVLDIEEHTEGRYSWAVNNHRPPTVGAENLQLSAQDIALGAWGDTISAQFDVSEGAKSLRADYVLPVNPLRVHILAGYEYSRSEILDSSFNDIDIKSELHSIHAGFAYFHIKDTQRAYKTAFKLEHRQSQDTLNGVDYPFNESSDNGETRITVARLTQSWLSRFTNDTLALQYTLNAGMQGLNATVSASEPDALFKSFIGQFIWIHPMPPQGGEFTLKANFQLASDPLLSMEQYSLGGVDSVRGFRENQLVRDRGWMLSAEYRRNLWRSLSGQQTVALSCFVDHGKAENKIDSGETRNELSSVGVGVHWDYRNKYRADLIWAEQLKNTDKDALDYDLQDDGLHFEVRGYF